MALSAALMTGRIHGVQPLSIATLIVPACCVPVEAAGMLPYRPFAPMPDRVLPEPPELLHAVNAARPAAAATTAALRTSFRPPFFGLGVPSGFPRVMAGSPPCGSGRPRSSAGARWGSPGRG